MDNAYQIVRNQTIAVGAASAALASAIGTGVSVVRLCSTTACHIKVGSAPTATTSDMYLPANTVQYISPTAGLKIAVIQNAAAGTLHVTELSE